MRGSAGSTGRSRVSGNAEGQEVPQAVPPGLSASPGCVPWGFLLLYPATGMGHLINNSSLACGKEGFGFE